MDFTVYISGYEIKGTCFIFYHNSSIVVINKTNNKVVSDINNLAFSEMSDMKDGTNSD